MYPQTYLNTFWQSEVRPAVFVAMSFDERYDARFAEAISPAIKRIFVRGTALEPIRVDIRKSGDSILTQISDGIAHSQLVLADVSTVSHDLDTKKHFRNANVLYEVGIALASRHPTP